MEGRGDCGVQEGVDGLGEWVEVVLVVGEVVGVGVVGGGQDGVEGRGCEPAEECVVEDEEVEVECCEGVDGLEEEPEEW